MELYTVYNAEDDIVLATGMALVDAVAFRDALTTLGDPRLAPAHPYDRVGDTAYGSPMKPTR